MLTISPPSPRYGIAALQARKVAVSPLVTDTDTATGTITENKLSISDMTWAEGTGSTTYAVFTVTLAQSSSLPVKVDYATANGTALGGSDYLAKRGTLLFAPGELNKKVKIPILGDARHENVENFFFNLTNPLNATFATSQSE